jgi:branched-chain amino acid transport system permease protein
MKKHLLLWAAYALVLVLLPSLFSSVLGISILNQMTIWILFALSYNMMLGQGGMLSFGHAVYFGLGGFMSVHALNLIADKVLVFSITLIPLVGGVFGLLAALFIGSFSTRKAGTVFAMISLGIGELIVASSLIFVDFFGGEAGVSGDRTYGPAFFGIEFLQDSEVYYLGAFWLFVATLLMYLFTQTPAGRMANAVRDNPERAEFIGYSTRRVRFITFCAAGMFAGVAGGLFAINYEFITEENLNALTSGRVLLMAYIGGLGFFIGPIIGAVILTLMNSLLSNYSEMWMLYLGILFLLTVMFLPKGFAGFIMMHRAAWNNGKMGSLVLPYCLTALPAGLFLTAFIGMVELSHADELLHFLSMDLANDSAFSWFVLAMLAAIGAGGVKLARPRLAAAWEHANAAAQEAKS